MDALGATCQPLYNIILTVWILVKMKTTYRGTEQMPSPGSMRHRQRQRCRTRTRRARQKRAPGATRTTREQHQITREQQRVVPPRPHPPHPLLHKQCISSAPPLGGAYRIFPALALERPLKPLRRQVPDGIRSDRLLRASGKHNLVPFHAKWSTWAGTGWRSTVSAAFFVQEMRMQLCREHLGWGALTHVLFVSGRQEATPGHRAWSKREKHMLQGEINAITAT